MARQKKQAKSKEPVRLRRKKLANGNESLYLDQYISETHKHKYEFLKLYIVPVVDNSTRLQNEKTLMMAEAIKSQRIIKLAEGKAGIETHTSRAKVPLAKWIGTYADFKLKTGKSDKSYHQIKNMLTHIEKYKGGVTLGEVDKDYCEGFLIYLADKSNGLSPATQEVYYKRFSLALGWAVDKDIICINYAKKVNKQLKPKVPESKREHLDADEIKALISTECNGRDTKQAYLFSCFCGLRISDIRHLTWGNIVIRDGKEWIEVVMQKTAKPLSVPLSRQAKEFLPARNGAKDGDNIFSLPSEGYVNAALSKWAKAAGIKKHLSFHTARHTFATIGLTAGVDLYTMSRLLGHQDIKVTQIYAKIVDKKKEEAMEKLDSLL